MYEYKATVLDIHDGDTIHAEVDLGIEVKIRLTLRFAGINAPELSTPAGVVSRDWLVAQIPIGSDIVIQTLKDRKEKYGRYLAWVWPASSPELVITGSVNEQMVQAGLAVNYP